MAKLCCEQMSPDGRNFRAVGHLATHRTQGWEIASFCLDRGQLEILILRGFHSQGGQGWFSALLIHIIHMLNVYPVLCIMQDAGEQWPADRCGPCALGSAVQLYRKKGCVSFSHLHSLSPFSLSFLQFICPLHTPIPRGLHPRKKAAGRVILIPAHGSLRVGCYHLVKRYFMMNEHVAASHTQS